MAIRELARTQSLRSSAATSFTPTTQRRKPLLTLVPNFDLEERVKNTRVFAVIIGLISAITFAGLLSINTLLTQDAITIQKLKIESLQLNEDREATIKALEQISNPAALAAAAEALGMKPSENPQFLDLNAATVFSNTTKIPHTTSSPATAVKP